MKFHDLNQDGNEGKRTILVRNVTSLEKPVVPLRYDKIWMDKWEEPSQVILTPKAM